MVNRGVGSRDVSFVLRVGGVARQRELSRRDLEHRNGRHDRRLEQAAGCPSTRGLDRQVEVRVEIGGIDYAAVSEPDAKAARNGALRGYVNGSAEASLTVPRLETVQR